MFEEKIRELMENMMSERGFKLWTGINDMLPNIWIKPTSSTGKYHQKADGRVPDVGEHTFEMLNAAAKIMSMFGCNPKTNEADIIMMSVALHDGLKYGQDGLKDHTIKEHDSMIADVVNENRLALLKLYSDDQINDLVDALRFHSGRWSNEADINNFSFSDRTPLAMFTHILDMLSTKDCLKI